MFKRSRRTVVKENAAAAAELTAQLAADKKFRRQLVAAAGHGVAAKQQVRRQVGMIALANRLASDRELRMELARSVEELQRAWRRLERKRSRRFRNTLIVLGAAGGAAAAAVPPVRAWLSAHVPRPSGRVGPRTVDASVDVDVPVSRAYNQWTQFEDFPLFMEGVDEVRQLDDTRLHWVATVGGRRAEWDAKILEQHPDRQISWISEDGRKTRGTVTFEPLGDARTRVHLSMGYQAEGLREALGSAAGIDTRRVQGDLERFRDMIEAQGFESGAWRGEISDGTKAARGGETT